MLLNTSSNALWTFVCWVHWHLMTWRAISGRPYNAARAVQRRSLPKVLAALRDATLAVGRVAWADSDEDLERALYNLLVGPHPLCRVCGLVTSSKSEFGDLAKSQLTLVKNTNRRLSAGSIKYFR
jgi:hypothetical protein